MSDDGNDSVGYGRPPKHTRFAKGKSGNAKGRPKGSKNLMTLLRNEGSRSVVVTENGEKQRISKNEAVAKKLYMDAMQGKPHAVASVISVDQRQAEAPELIRQQKLEEEDEAILEEFIKNLRENNNDT
jgi:hypothetical protein